MDTQPLHETTAQPDNGDVFLNFVFGLDIYFQRNASVVPKSLRRALDAVSFARPDRLPKTLYQFLEQCHQPVMNWYPLPVPEIFNSYEPILYDHHLSEEAREFTLVMAEQMQLDPASDDDIPQTALDNRQMLELRQRLKASSDSQSAQQLYVQVRSFLIEHSWTTRDQLHDQPRAVFQELRGFYDEIPDLPFDELKVCERCGLLRWRDNRWQGVKPNFCSDHGVDSPLVRSIPNLRHLWRLKEGSHLRTFLPGQLERALFTVAERLWDTYPDHLLEVERYPGLDTYDLRLTFSDGEVWAVDAKDQSYPGRLAAQIQPLYGEGNLFYTHAFYVIPDERKADLDYWEHLEYAVGVLPDHLFITSALEFQQRVEEKLKSLSTPPRKAKRA